MEIHEKATFLFYYDATLEQNSRTATLRIQGTLVKGELPVGSVLHFYTGEGRHVGSGTILSEPEEKEQGRKGLLKRRRNEFEIKIDTYLGKETIKMNETGKCRYKICSRFLRRKEGNEMTMQGISNVLPKAAAAVAEKSEKAKGTLFEAVMSSQGNKQQTKKTMDGFAPDDRVDNRMAKKELAANRYQKSKAISTKSDTAASNDTQDSLTVNQMADDELDIEEVTVVLASQVTVLLQDLFGLTNDELQDILNSLDLQLQEDMTPDRSLWRLRIKVTEHM